MPKKTISAKIGVIVDREARIEANRRNISFSRLVEIALIHELNNKDNNHGLIVELEDLKEIINNKINDLKVNSNDNNVIKDEDYYINELISMHKHRGKLTYDIIKNYSDKSGLTIKELLNRLNKYLSDLIIDD